MGRFPLSFLWNVAFSLSLKCRLEREGGPNRKGSRLPFDAGRLTQDTACVES